jgi:hypothetical protein
MTEEIEPKEGVSRRKMIKRIGAGAAIAWTAPILTSIRTPAFAASPSCAEPCDAVCGNFPSCGSSCFCSRDAGGACFCWTDNLCANLQDCGPGNSCPTGQTCVSTCCDQANGTPIKCFSTCGAHSAHRGVGATGSHR